MYFVSSDLEKITVIIITNDTFIFDKKKIETVLIYFVCV